jgi:hypothetical protein
MLRHSLWGRAAVAVAGLGLMIPNVPAQAEVAARPAVRTIGQDVLLQAGVLQGQYVDAQGAGVAGAKVTVLQRGAVVAQTQTNELGAFQVALPQGAYEVAVGSEVQVVRVWDAQMAPKSAREAITFTAGQQLRGQCCDDINYLGLAAIGIGTAALVVGIIALDEANDAKKNQSN